MSKILVAKMQLLTAMQQGNLKEAQVLLNFINKHDKKAQTNQTYKELSHVVPIAKAVEDIEEKLDKYYEDKGIPNPHVDYEEVPYDEDGYESYDSKEQNEQEGQQGSGEEEDEEDEEDVTSEEEEKPKQNGVVQEEKVEEDPGKESDTKSVAPTPSISEVSTAPTATSSKANRHCCAHK